MNFVFRRNMVALAAIALLAAPGVAASAQGAGGGGGGGGFQGRRGMRGGFQQTGLSLLRWESVQKELKMTPDQIAKIASKQEDMRSKMGDLRQSFGPDASPADRAAAMQKMQELNEGAVADILDHDQLHRFHQLELQRMGSQALQRKDVQDKLNMTDDQRAQVKSILDQARADSMAAFQAGDRDKAREIQASANEKLNSVLTDGQKAHWKEMVGEKLDFGQPPARPGGGPGGPGGGPPPGQTR